MGARRVSDETKRAILARIAEGKTYPEIASECGVSPATVYNINRNAKKGISPHAQTSLVSKATKDRDTSSSRLNIRAFISKVKKTKEVVFSEFSNINPSSDAEYEIVIDHTEETVIALQGLVTKWNGGPKMVEHKPVDVTSKAKDAPDETVSRFLMIFVEGVEDMMEDLMGLRHQLSSHELDRVQCGIKAIERAIAQWTR